MGHGLEGEARAALTARRDALRDHYLLPREARPASSARGVHHTAMISSDVERTIRFYVELCGFPLLEMFENRDYQGSTHFFFDLGQGRVAETAVLPREVVKP